MLVLENVSKYFSGRCVLSRVNLQFTPGAIVGLVGPSGAGKSVLLKIIAGILQPDIGQVVFSQASEEAQENSASPNNSFKTGFLFQEGALFDSMSVIENVAYPLLNLPNSEFTAAYSQAHEILCAVGLGQAWRKYPGQLSGGMRKRLALARALVHDPDLALLDDPTAGLDPVAASVIMKLVLDLHRRHRPLMVLVSQDIRRLLPHVERVIALFNGEVVYDGSAQMIPQGAPAEVVKFLSTRFDFTTFSNASSPT